MRSITILRARRRELGLSLDELGRRTDIERSRLSRAEREYVPLSHEELKRLALHLGLEMEQLVTVPTPGDNQGNSPAGGAS